MSKGMEKGREGELLAVKMLEEKGYHILERNWRYLRAEVDIIAALPEVHTLVFVEVKTRSSTAFGFPEDFVDTQKQQLLSVAASAYCEQVGHEGELRFDLVSVLLWDEGYEVRHLPDAFFPGLF